MKIFERIIFAAGLFMLAFLLWRFDAPTVWAQVCRVGWGFLAIFSLQICDHALNAVGWRYAFAAPDATRVPFWKLVGIRVAGDGVNYLTPSATIAGEIIRPGMLPDALPAQVRNSSVVVAKFAQSLGQALFALVGLLMLLPRLGFLSGRQIWAAIFGCLTVFVLVGAGMALLAARRRDGTHLWRLSETLSAMREQMVLYLREHPRRFFLSTFFFVLGYAWGAVEVLVICFFLGMRLDLATALCVEVLSVMVDSLFFMVPAKAGTQEAGKIAIFIGLGLPAAQGLAFGLVRHVRELAWAGAGFAMYAADRRRRANGALPTLCALPEEPVARADS